jgi:hypothetical protein
MKRTLVAAALLALAGNAWASDLPIPKKAPAWVGYPYTQSGVYVGLGALGEVASAKITGADIGTSLYSAGAALSGTIGYQGQLFGGSNWWAAENIVSWTNIGGTVTCAVGVPCSIGSQFGVEQRLLFGFPIMAMLSVLPNWGSLFPALPPLPNGVVSTSSHPYVMAGLHEDDVSAAFGLMTGRAWQITPAVGVGMLNQWTNGLVIDTWVEHSFGNTSFGLGPSGLGLASANQGSKTIAGVTVKY